MITFGTILLAIFLIAYGVQCIAVPLGLIVGILAFQALGALPPSHPRQ